MCLEMYALFSGRFSVERYLQVQPGDITYLKITSPTTQPHTKLWLHKAIKNRKYLESNLSKYFYCFVNLIVLHYITKYVASWRACEPKPKNFWNILSTKNRLEAYLTRSENGTYQHDVVYYILIFNQNDKNVYF